MVWRLSPSFILCIKLISAGVLAYVLTSQLLNLLVIVLLVWLHAEAAILTTALFSYPLFVLLFLLVFLASENRLKVIIYNAVLLIAVVGYYL